MVLREPAERVVPDVPFLHLLVSKRSHPFLAAEFVAQDLAGDGLIGILPNDLQQDLEGVVRIAGPQGLAAQNVEVGRVMIFDLAKREPQVPLFFGKGGRDFRSHVFGRFDDANQGRLHRGSQIAAVFRLVGKAQVGKPLADDGEPDGMLLLGRFQFRLDRLKTPRRGVPRRRSER